MNIIKELNNIVKNPFHEFINNHKDTNIFSGEILEYSISQESEPLYTIGNTYESSISKTKFINITILPNDNTWYLIDTCIIMKYTPQIIYAKNIDAWFLLHIETIREEANKAIFYGQLVEAVFNKDKYTS